MNHPQTQKLIEGITRIADVLEARLPMPKYTATAQAQATMQDLAGEFTSMDINDVPKLDVNLDEKTIVEQTSRWVHENTTFRPNSTALEELLVVVKRLCHDAAKGDLTIIEPEVFGKLG